MNQELPEEPHDKGLEEVLRVVRDGAKPPETWEPTGEHAEREPVRLLVSRKLSLVAVIDYRLVQDQVRRDIHDPDQADFLTGLVQMAREVRFAIQDADTAQVSVLIVAVRGEPQFKELSRGVFGPGGSKGDVVVRVVDVEKPDTLDLDLEVVREAIMPVPERQWSGTVADMSETAQGLLREGSGADMDASAAPIIRSVGECFARPDALTGPAEAASRLHGQLVEMLDEWGPPDQEEGAL